MKLEQEPSQPDFESRKALVAKIGRNTLVQHGDITLRNVHPDNEYFPHFLYGENMETGESVTIRLDDNSLPIILEGAENLETRPQSEEESGLRKIEKIGMIDSRLIDVGFDPEVIKEVRQLVIRLELPNNARALFLGPSATPLQFLLAGDENSVEVVEKSQDTHKRIADLSQRLQLESTLNLLEGENSDVLTVMLNHDNYDIIFALNILDLVGENREVYTKVLKAIKDGGKIAIGHYDTGIGTREQNNLDQYAQDLRYGLEDLKIVVDEGHKKTDQWYSDDSTIFKVYKTNIPERARGKDLSNIADVFKLFSGLK